jgi:hypothetical protein
VDEAPETESPAPSRYSATNPENIDEYAPLEPLLAGEGSASKNPQTINKSGPSSGVADEKPEAGMKKAEETPPTQEGEAPEAAPNTPRAPVLQFSWCIGVTGKLRDPITSEEVCGMMAGEVMRQRIEDIRAEYEHVFAETGDEKKAKDAVDPLKKKLPAVLWAGVFEGRGNDNLTVYSHCLVADIDGLTVKQAEKLHAELDADPHVHKSFVSPTGHGVKAVVAVAGGPKDHDANFRAVKRYIADRYGYEIDPSGRNLERLCFFSYSPKGRWRSDVTLIEASASDRLNSRVERGRKVVAKVEALAENGQPPVTNCGGKRRRSPGADALKDNQRTGTMDLTLRAKIAERILGSIEWKRDSEGFLPCPNIEAHTTGDGARDCRVTIDGVPTLFCLHAHCAPGTKAKPGGLDDVNHKLRSEIAKAEHQRDGDIIARLATLDVINYERERDGAAIRLGVRTSALDALVRNERGRRERAEKGLSFEDVEPWPEPVDGGALATDLCATLWRYMVMADEACLATVLFVFHTFGVSLFPYSPILHVRSPERTCGKSRLFELLSQIVCRALAASGVTAATLFRAIQAFDPTLLLDEFDSQPDDLQEGIRNVLNSGFHKDGVVLRCVGDDHRVETFRTFCAKAIAGIGELPDTAASRSIPIALNRKLPGEKVKRLRGFDGTELRRKLARWMADHRERLQCAAPVLPEELSDRQQDIWEPLLAIADALGGEWPQMARDAALFLCQKEAGESLAIELLKDTRMTFEEMETDRLATEMLLQRLCGRDDRPWATLAEGKPMRAHKLAQMLRRFDIAPGNIAIGPARPKGYLLSQFEDAFARYLP